MEHAVFTRRAELAEDQLVDVGIGSRAAPLARPAQAAEYVVGVSEAGVAKERKTTLAFVRAGERTSNSDATRIIVDVDGYRRETALAALG